MDTLGRRRSRTLQVVPWLGMAAMGAVTAYVLRKRAKEEEVAPLSDERIMSPEAFELAEPGRGRCATTLREITWRGWRDILWRTMLEIPRDRLPIIAGGITFFSLLALVPSLSAFVAIYGILADVNAVQEQIGQLSLFFPAAVTEVIGGQMLRLSQTEGATLSLTFLGSLLVAFWSAGAGINAVIDGVNIAYGEAEKRNWLRRRALVVGFTAAAIVLVVTLLLLLVALPIAVTATYGLAPDDIWWVPFRWLAALALIAFTFSAIYRYGPCRARAKQRWVWLGGTAAAIVWLLGSLIYSLYVTYFSDLEAAYGALGVAIGFMVWVWFSAMVLLLGAELNAEIEHQTAVDTTTGPEMPMGQRGAAVADSVGLAFTGFNVAKVRGHAEKVWSRLRKTPA